MQQHLAHLYFLTVLEQLQTKAHKPNFLVRLASKIDKVRTIYSNNLLCASFITFYRVLQQCVSDTTPDTAKVLLFIEKQAVVQVLIQQLVSFFDPKCPEKIQDVSQLHQCLKWL